ncbi:MAG: metal ABC transporter substrate-binding protein [Thiohalophilus sp.]
MRIFNKSVSLALFTLLFATATQAVAKVDVLACEPEWAALAEAIGQQRVNVVSATTAYQDPHHIEARPSLIARARSADLVVCTGAELEVGWLPLLLRQSGNGRIQQGKPGYFMAAEQVALIEKLESVDRSMGDIHAAGNPHLHLDPYRLLKVAKQLVRRLEKIDPDNGAAYQSNFEAFSERWQTAIDRWEKKAQTLRGRKAVVQHRTWSYLFAWLGVEAVADIEPRPGLPPTSGHLASLLEKIKRDRPDFIILAAYQNERGAQWLSRRSQLPVITLPYTVGGSEQAGDLFSLYDTMLDQLLEATR